MYFKKNQTKDFIRSLVNKYIPKHSSIIEISCGRGHLLKALKNDGYTVVGTNYSEYIDAEKDIKIINGIDITNPTGLEGEKFKCVILSESIQNISNHYKVFQEIEKLTVDDGLIIITTPNINNIKSRLHFLFTGFFKIKWNFIGFDVPYEESFCYHNHPMHIPTDMYYILKSNLDPIIFCGFNKKIKSIFLYILLAIPIIIMTKYNIKKKEPYLSRSNYSQQLSEIMTSFDVLTSERLCLVLKKTIYSNTERTTPKVTWYKKYSEANPELAKNKLSQQFFSDSAFKLKI